MASLEQQTKKPTIRNPGCYPIHGRGGRTTCENTKTGISPMHALTLRWDDAGHRVMSYDAAITRRLHGMIFLGGKNNIGLNTLHRRHLALTPQPNQNPCFATRSGHFLRYPQPWKAAAMTRQQSRVVTLQTPLKDKNRSLSFIFSRSLVLTT